MFDESPVSVFDPDVRAFVQGCLEDFRYERTDHGTLLLPKGNKKADGKVEIGGRFRHAVNTLAARLRGDMSFTDIAIDSNLIVFEGIDYVLATAFKGTGQTSAYFIAPYAGAVDPSQALTHATWVAALTEFVNYTEGARQSWATDAEAAQTVHNATTPAVFTLNTGGGTVNGAALVSSSAKSAVTGLLIAASRFGAARVMLAGDKLSLEYDIVGSDPTA